MSAEPVDAEFTESTALAVRPAGNSVAVWTPSFAIAVDEAVQRVEAKHDFFRRVMKAGQHYGIVPGTSRKDDDGKEQAKPALFKPGAELLLANMGLQAEFSDADAPTVDYGEEGREGIVRYRRVCRIFRQIGQHENERMQVARAEGSCSSREAKYRWRNTGAACPDCGKPLRLSKDKPEWYCWRKQSGCGQTFPKAQFSFEKVANPDLADLENTILKMADKRALVAATLIATGCSDIFTQDIDEQNEPPDYDMGGVGTAQEAKTYAKAGEGTPAGSSPAASQHFEPRVTDEQLEQIKTLGASVDPVFKASLLDKHCGGKLNKNTTRAQAEALITALGDLSEESELPI